MGELLWIDLLTSVYVGLHVTGVSLLSDFNQNLNAVN